ncbi:GPN-loop GTPase 2 [Halotydeus destructor]|nr:GPN-loop GTPase 2 [Halotydeus destructor]
MNTSPSVSNPIFGQIVTGPPGSGKTTYCKNIAEVLTSLGRDVRIVNMDPANDISLPYKPSIDISSLIRVEEVMERLGLGPNGGLIYAVEYLDENIDWLFEQIKKSVAEQKELAVEPAGGSKNLSKKSPYFIFDCPGQIELYTHNESFKNVVNKLTNHKVSGFDLRLAAVYLVDSHYANDAGKFISAVLNSLAAMLHLELPHVNLLSKVDLMSRYGSTQFGLNYFCEVLDLSYLVDQVIDDPLLAKYKEMTKKLSDVIENYSLVSFLPLNINDNRSIIRAIRTVDKAIGYHLIDIETEEEMERIFREFESADFEYGKYGQDSEQLTP